jgi:ribosomal subunit interface protein
MNISVNYFGVTKRDAWQQLVETRLAKLQRLATVAKARVRLELQHNVNRAFRVLMELEVPGPDFHAEASDYTLPAALEKAVKNLEKQIRSRKCRQVDRWKTNLQLGLNPGRCSSGLAG